MRNKIIKLSLIGAFLVLPFFVSVTKAGMGGMGPPVPCGGPFNPCPIPLDGGVSLLLIAGAAYGAKKIYDLSRKKNPS